MIMADNVFEVIDERIKELEKRIDSIEGDTKHDQLREIYIQGGINELKDIKEFMLKNFEPEW